MDNTQNTEPLWTDLEPNDYISQTELPTKANEIKLLAGDWLVKNTKYLDLFKWDDLNERYWRRKAFCEIGGFLLSAKGFDDRDSYSSLENVIIKRVNDQRFADQILRSPQKLHFFAFPTLYTKYVDKLGAETETAFKQAVDLGNFMKFEWPAYRWVEFWFIANIMSQLFDEPQREYDIKSILEYSLLNHQPDIIRSGLPHAYCLTHDVMFYNNFVGVCDKPFPEDPAPYDITDLLPGLILRYMAADDCDIVLELVMIGVLQRQISKEMVQFVISWVMEKIDEYGYVPSPEHKTRMVTDPLSRKALDLETDDKKWEYKNEQEETWAENYHTTLVAGHTARVIERDWDKLYSQSSKLRFEDSTFRRDVTRLGQLVFSLGNYDLKSGANQMKELAESPVISKFPNVSQKTIDFLKAQRTQDGEFGYWTQEKIMYCRAGYSPKSFNEDLVRPISKACQEGIDAIESEREDCS